MSDSGSPTTTPGDQDTIVICGWSAQGLRLVQDLQAVSPLLSITVISHLHDPECPSVPSGDRLHYIDGDPTSEDVLSQAPIASSPVIVALADRGYTGKAQTLDARTILTALTIRSISKKPHLIAELRNEDNYRLAENAGIDEAILADRYSGVMLSQSVQSSGLSELFTQLFETGAGSTFDEQQVPPGLVDVPFSKAVAKTIGLGLGALAGLRRGDELHLPPKQDLMLEAGDRLLLMHPV